MAVTEITLLVEGQYADQCAPAATFRRTRGGRSILVSGILSREAKSWITSLEYFQ